MSQAQVDATALLCRLLERDKPEINGQALVTDHADAATHLLRERLLVRLRAVLAGVVALEPKLQLQVPDIARLAAGVSRVMCMPERLPIPVLPREDRWQRQWLAGVRPDQR